MDRPLVGLDVDGVLCDFVKEFLRLSRKYLTKPKKGYIHSTYWFENAGWTKKEVDYLWLKIRHTNNFWMTLDKLPKTNELMRRQKEFNLAFITSRVATDGLPVVDQVQEWLFNQFAIKDPLVIVTDKKGLAAKELGLEAFIDDKDSHCLEVQKACPEAFVAIQDTTYNKEFENGKYGIERVSSLAEFFKRLKEG